MKADSLLRKLRLEGNIKLETVAKAAEMSVSGYYSVETGIRTVNKRAAEAISMFFGVPVDALFVPVSFSVREIEGA